MSHPRVQCCQADITCQVKTLSVSFPMRAVSKSLISTSPTTSATAAVSKTSDFGENAPPLSVTGKPRREVPLPSQEPKKGAMQYAL